MYEFCHRCQGELRGAAGSGELLFCPHCSAPQILLPEHLRPEGSEAPSTGVVPPPMPAAGAPPVSGARQLDSNQIDWRAALSAGAVVAGVAAVLNVIGLKVGAVGTLGTLWVMGGAVIAMGLYARSRPGTVTNARLGLRIGAATGVLMVTMLGIALAVSGVVARFGLHGMSAFDTLLNQQVALMQAQMVTGMNQQGRDPLVEARVVGIMGSPEVRGGITVAYEGVLAGLIVLLSAGGGAFSGMLRAGQKARGQAR